MRQTWSTPVAREHAITLAGGIRVGHHTDLDAATGCTVILCDEPGVAGIDIRGGATATHDTTLLGPTGLVERLDAVVLTGGSAPGLGCIAGVSRWLRDKGRGFPTREARIPITPGAAIYDLAIGNPSAFPTPDNAHAACEHASEQFERGSVGAGAGATTGKLLGQRRSMRGGLGTSGWRTDDGLTVGALAVVNGFGDIVDPATGRIVAGLRDEHDAPLGTRRTLIDAQPKDLGFGTNTTLAVVATNARLTKAQACVVARIAQTGIARAVSPCHTQFDGDLVIAISTGSIDADLNRVGALGAACVEAAIIDGVLSAHRFSDVPCAHDLGWSGRSDP